MFAIVLETRLILIYLNNFYECTHTVLRSNNHTWSCKAFCHDLIHNLPFRLLYKLPPNANVSLSDFQFHARSPFILDLDALNFYFWISPCRPATIGL